MTATDTQAAVDAGRASATANSRITHIEHPLDPKIRVPLVLDVHQQPSCPSDALAELDTRYAKRPRAGTTQLTEVDSLIAHVLRWGSEQTVIYADTAALSLTAVLDDHPADPTTTAARQHRAHYACPRSAEWTAWTALDSKPQGQTQFADFIESRLEDMVGGPGYPAPTDVLQVARTLNIMTTGQYRREINPTNGDYVFTAKQDTDSKSTQIPRAFLIAIPVFDGGTRYQIEARVRFTLTENRPAFSFTLYRRAEIERDAFGEVRAKVAKETGRLVLAGVP